MATAELVDDDLPPIEVILDSITRVIGASSTSAISPGSRRRPATGTPEVSPLQSAVPNSNLVVQLWHTPDALPDQLSACGRHMFPVGPRLIIAHEKIGEGARDMAGRSGQRSVTNQKDLQPSLNCHHFQDDTHVLSLASVGPQSTAVLDGVSTPNSASSSPKVLSRTKHPAPTVINPADCNVLSPLHESQATQLVSALNSHLALLPRNCPILIPTHTSGLLGLQAVHPAPTSNDLLPSIMTVTQPILLPPMCPLLMPTATLPHADLLASLYDCHPDAHPLSDIQVVAQYVLGPGVFVTVRWRATGAPAAVHAFVAANTPRTWRGIELGHGLLASHPEVMVHVRQVEGMGSPQVRKVEREIGQCIRWWRIQEGEDSWNEQAGEEVDQSDEPDEEGDNTDEEHPRPKVNRPAKRAKKMGVADHVDAFLDHLANLGNDPSALFGDDNIDDDNDADDPQALDSLVLQQPSLIMDSDLATSPTMSRRILPNRTDHDFTERLWVYLRTARDADDLTGAMEAIVDAIESGAIVPQVSPSNPSYFAGTLRKALAYSALQATSVVKAKALEEVTQELDIFVDDPMSQVLEVSLWKLARDCMHYFSELETLGAIAPVGEWAQLDQLDMIRVLRAWVKALAVVVHVDTYAPGLPRAVLDGLAAKLVSQRLVQLRPDEEASEIGGGHELEQGDEHDGDDAIFDTERAASDNDQRSGEQGTTAPLGSFLLPPFSPDTAQFVARLPPASQWTVTLASRTTPDIALSTDGAQEPATGQGMGSLLDAVWTIDIRQRHDLAGMLSGDELQAVERAKVSMGEHPDTDTPRFEVTVGKAECMLV